MRTNSWVLYAILTAMAATTSSAIAAGYSITDRIRVEDGPFDYATYNPQTGLIYMPRGSFTTVIDPKTEKASRLDNAASDHIALPIPHSNLLVLTQRKGTIRILDAITDKVLTDLPGENNPNSAAYDPATRTAVVLNKGSGTATLIDPTKRIVVGTIPIAKETLEFPAANGRGLVFDNIETTGEIATIDVKRRKVVRRFKLSNCEEPSGLAYDAADNALISACGNGVAKVVQADTGKELASVSIGHGPDAVIYDANRKLAFIPCGDEGVLDVISLKDIAHIAVVQTLQTQQGSRTGVVDPISGRLYLMASKADTSAKTPPGGRTPRLAGTWEVLVISP